MAVFETTQQQYQNITGTNPSSEADKAREEANVLPANALKFGNDTAGNSAKICAKKLRDKTTLSGFDLPTEAEWEFACRAGTTSSLNSGMNVSSSAYYSGSDWRLDEVGWYASNSSGNDGQEPKEVGLKKPNAFGLYDMHGNVREWCLDWFSNGSDYVASFGEGWTPETVVVNPTGPAEETSSFAGKHSTRGGDYYQNSFAYYCRSASRADSTKSSGTGSRRDGVRVKLVLSAE